MTLQQLRFLVACAASRDISLAALRMDVSTGTLVRGLKALEEELAVDLIYLRSRPVSLTMQGERLVQRAEHILAITTQGIDDLRRSENRLVGSLRIALSLSYGHRLVYESLADFASRAPEVRLELRDIPFATHLQHLQRGELDIALLFPSWNAPGISFETLVHERVTAVLPKKHRLARRTEIRLGELADEKWLVFYKPDSGRVGIDFYEACKRCGFEPMIAQEVQSPLVRLAHVELNEGITLLPSSYDPGVRKTIKRVLLHRDDLSLPVSIMWKEHDTRQVVQAFIESVRQTVIRIYGNRNENLESDYVQFFLPFNANGAGYEHLGPSKSLMLA